MKLLPFVVIPYKYVSIETIFRYDDEWWEKVDANMAQAAYGAIMYLHIDRDRAVGISSSYLTREMVADMMLEHANSLPDIPF